MYRKRNGKVTGPLAVQVEVEATDTGSARSQPVGPALLKWDDTPVTWNVRGQSPFCGNCRSGEKLKFSKLDPAAPRNVTANGMPVKMIAVTAAGGWRFLPLNLNSLPQRSWRPGSTSAVSGADRLGDVIIDSQQPSGSVQLLVLLPLKPNCPKPIEEELEPYLLSVSLRASWATITKSHSSESIEQFALSWWLL
jgi:hypothetical protein